MNWWLLVSIHWLAPFERHCKFAQLCVWSTLINSELCVRSSNPQQIFFLQLDFITLRGIANLLNCVCVWSSNPEQMLSPITSPIMIGSPEQRPIFINHHHPGSKLLHIVRQEEKNIVRQTTLLARQLRQELLQWFWAFMPIYIVLRIYAKLQRFSFDWRWH